MLCDGVELWVCLALLFFGIMVVTNKISNFEGEINTVENGTALFEQKETEIGIDLKIKFNQTEEMLSTNVSFKGKTEDATTAFQLQSHEVQRYFDYSFTLVADLYDYDDIRCYSDEGYDKIKFLPVPYTGQGNGSQEIAPSNINTDEKYSAFYLNTRFYSGRYGPFECKIEEENGAMEIVTLVFWESIREVEELRALNPYQVANLGDTVKLEVFVRYDNLILPVKWRHNGVDVPSWNGLLKVGLRNVQPADDGVYEGFYEGRRKNGTLMRLIVRKCKINMYGDNCDQMCPPCYNGGICHDTLGICVCPAGFTGPNCELACGENRFGPYCSEICRGLMGGDWTQHCRFYLFCKPHPYGCSCARGFRGFYCMDACDPGWYGADCKQPCHCANGPGSCNRVTGACRGGCLRGWTGNSCQIKECEPGWYGANCEQTCHCDYGSDACNRVTGACTGGCSTGWSGNSCHIKDAEYQGDSTLIAGE